MEPENKTNYFKTAEAAPKKPVEVDEDFYWYVIEVLPPIYAKDGSVSASRTVTPRTIKSLLTGCAKEARNTFAFSAVKAKPRRARSSNQI